MSSFTLWLSSVVVRSLLQLISGGTLDDSLQPKASRACISVIALCHSDSWRLYFQLYYPNYPGKYVQWLYYQFMAPPATPLIQQLKHCNQWFKSCKRDINLSQDCLQPCRRDNTFWSISHAGIFSLLETFRVTFYGEMYWNSEGSNIVCHC